MAYIARIKKNTPALGSNHIYTLAITLSWPLGAGRVVVRGRGSAQQPVPEDQRGGEVARGLLVVAIVVRRPAIHARQQPLQPPRPQVAAVHLL